MRRTTEIWAVSVLLFVALVSCVGQAGTNGNNVSDASVVTGGSTETRSGGSVGNASGGAAGNANGGAMGNASGGAAGNANGGAAGNANGGAFGGMPSPFPDGSRRVWVHYMYVFPWSDNPPDKRPYGAEYPIWLTPVGTKIPRKTPNYFVNAGFTGIQMLWWEHEDASGQFENWLSGNNGYSALDGGPLELAPCFSFETQAGALSMIKKYVAIAEKHPAASRNKTAQGTSYVFFVYGGRYDKPVSFWKELKSAVAAAGINAYWVGDVVTAISYNGGKLKPDLVQPFSQVSVRSMLGVFDVAWTFDDGVDLDWATLVSTMSNAGQLFAGGMLPAYNRESLQNGGYSDAEGTAKYRRQWEFALASGLAWNNVVSWNDLSERHEIEPTSDWNVTRSDVTAFFSAKLRGVPYEAALASPQLYVTTPTRLNIGSVARTAEAMVLNTGATPVAVSIQLFDGKDAPLGVPTSSTVAADRSGDASIAMKLTVVPEGHFARARAIMKDNAGNILQDVWSAPILVYGANEQATGFDATRAKYQSIPARRALKGTTTLLISGGSPTQAVSLAKATVQPPANVNVRFAEVLQNTHLVKNFFADANRTVAIPGANGVSNMNSLTVSTPASGFYVARVIDEDEHVGYSTPLYFP
jgi:hypothetical protein